MMHRLRLWWERVSNSYWFVPSLLTLAGAVLAAATVALDRRVTVEAGEAWLVFGVGAEGARGVLSAISASMLTVTGVVFSITVVALQLASQQFTPRVLRTFAADRAGHVVLGVLIGTFTYALLVERTVRSPRDELASFVPSISVSVAVLLALASVAALIFFIHHTAHAIRASTIIHNVTSDVHRVIDRLYPEQLGRPAEEAPAPPTLPAAGGVRVPASGAGYLQAVDEQALFHLGGGGWSVRIHPVVGDFVMAGDPLVTAWPPPGEAADGDADGLARRVNRAFVLGAERTLQQDVRRGILELVEIAVKALSPSVNDPTTAILCIDRLGDVVARLGCREFPPPSRAGGDGRILLYAPRQEFGALAELAFDQVRHYGADSPVVMLHLLAILGRVGRHVPAHRRQALRTQALRTQALRIRDAAGARIAVADDAERVRRAADEALLVLQQDPE